MRKNKVALFTSILFSTSIMVTIMNYQDAAVLALSPTADTPEEILRTEIILEARSPIDGKPLTAAEYAELQAKLQQSPPIKLNSSLRQTVFLLQLRKTLFQFFPFLDLLF